MSTRGDAIAELLTRWLNRYQVPYHLRDNPQAKQDEADSLLKVLLKLAPSSGYEAWVAQVLENCSHEMTSRAWPIVAELLKACRCLRKDMVEPRSEGQKAERSKFDILAKQIENRQPIGEHIVFGPMAVKLIAEGKVGEADLKIYREAHIENIKTQLPIAAAQKKIDELNARYAASLQEVNELRGARN